MAVGVLAANLALKLHDIAAQSLWGDEALTLFVGQQPLSLVRLYTYDTTPPLYYLLSFAWMRLFGFDLIHLRAFSTILSALTAVAILLYGRRFLDLPTGVLAALLFTFSAIHFYYAQEARSYALVGVLCVASFYVFGLVLERPSGARLVALTGLDALLLYAHFVAGFALAAQLAASWLVARRREVWLWIAGAEMAALVLLAPWLAFVVAHWPPAASSWLVAPKPGDIRYVLKTFAGSSLALALYGFILGICWLRCRSGPGFRTRTRQQMTVLLLWAFLPIVLDYVISQRLPMFLHRYLLYTSLGLFLCVAASLTTSDLPHIVQASAIVTVLEVSLVDFVAHPIHRPDWQRAVALVRADRPEVRRSQASEPPIVVAPWADCKAFAYYFDRDAFTDYAHLYERLERENVLCSDDPADAVRAHAAADRWILLASGRRRKADGEAVAALLGRNYTRIQDDSLDGVAVSLFAADMAARR